jgi:Zn-dependent M16 (insulinase) family peptidase
MISDFLYGRSDGSQIAEALDDIKLNNILRTWSNKQWTDFIQKCAQFMQYLSISYNSDNLHRYFVDPNRVVVRGKPSAAVAERLEKEEKARIAKQKAALGPQGLAQKAKELEDAKAEHEKPIPTEVLKSFPVPDVKSISWIPVQSVQQVGMGRQPRTPALENDVHRHVSMDGPPPTFFVQYDHVKVCSTVISTETTSRLTHSVRFRYRPCQSVPGETA